MGQAGGGRPFTCRRSGTGALVCIVMADTPPVSQDQNPYKDKQYQEQRQAWFNVIPKSSFLNAIRNNTGTLNYLLAAAVMGAIVSGVLSIPAWGVVALGAAAVAVAGVNAYVAYLDEKISKTVDLGYREARQIADSRVMAKEYAKEMAVAIKDTLGEELKEIKKETCQTQAAVAQNQAVVAHLQKQMLSWQEREAAKEPAEKVLG